MRTLKLQEGIIYGPINSRRLGRSLGINLLPTTYKLCTFNCIYCHYGWTDIRAFDLSERVNDIPTPDDVYAALQKALASGCDVNHITFSGNGEPTLHPQFDEMVDIARELKEKYLPQAKLAILSNSSTLFLEKVRQALSKLEVRILKLDAGDSETFQKINRPCKEVDYQRLLSGLKATNEFVLQTVLVEGKFNNTDDDKINRWIERIGEIGPEEVQIYSIDRPPADQTLEKVSSEKLGRIADKAEGTTGIPVKVFTSASVPHSQK